MSHFAVLVIGEDIDGQLAPYSENTEICGKSALRFVDSEPEYRKKWKNEKIKMVRMGDGTYKYTWDDQFKSGPPLQQKTEIPKHLKVVSVSYRKLYKDFDEFMVEYAGSSKDPKKGKYGYWTNPRSRWDWYTVGGRWTGAFKMKSGVAGAVGKPGLMTAPAEPGHADQARMADIDFEGMAEDKAAAAGESYDRLHRLLGGNIEPLAYTWDKVLKEKRFAKLNIDEKRTLYHGQKALLRLQSAAKDPSLDSKDRQFLSFLQYESFLVGRKKYVEAAIKGSFSAFAVVKDGKWYERGEMGWWAAVSNEKSAGRWDREFAKLIAGLKPENLLTMVDCHV